MAITKILNIKESEGRNPASHLKNALEYIQNPDKIEECVLVGGINCLPDTAFEQMEGTKNIFHKTGKRQGYHVIISFSPEEKVTSEQAMYVLEHFAKDVLGDDYEAVYAVHTDREHMHGHLIWNSVSMTTGKKYNSHKNNWKNHLQPITNKYCDELGLSIMPAEYSRNPKNISRDKWEKEMSMKEIILRDAKMCAYAAGNMEHFKYLMKRLGYVFKKDAWMEVQAPGFRYYHKLAKLDEMFSEDMLRHYVDIVAWDLGCLLAALLIILLRCRKIKNRKMLWMPFGAYGLSVVYGIAYYLNLPFWKIFSSDMTAALCLLFALIIESCIQCGLIPSNTGYAQLFAASTISAQITDQSGKCIYQSQDSECIAPEIVRQVVQCPIMLENGIRLSGKPILGGYVLWKENLSELQEIVRELEDRKEELKDANLIEEENLRTKREVEKLSVKNQLYDKIQKQTARQSKLLTEFIEAYSMEEDENKREKILGKIVVIGAYIKRRSNLIFIAEQTVKFPIRELELCFRESIKNLEWNHVEAGFSTALEEIRSEDAMQIYDFFEAVIEESLEDLLAFNVNLKRREARIIMSMSVECKTDLQEIARRYGAYAEQDFDGSWLLSLILGGGGGK